MRLCRVCLTEEGDDAFELILQDDYKVAVDLFYVCGVVIVESFQSALICVKCKKEVEDAARLKKVAVLADQFFRKQTREAEKSFYLEFKESELQQNETEEVIVESLDPEEEYEIIEYDDTPICEEVWAEDTIEVPTSIEHVTEEAAAKKSFAPRKTVTGRQIHQCECGIVFSSNHRLQNHIRVKHDFVPESEMLPCSLCDKKFKIQEYLELHMRNKHSNNPLKKPQKNPCSQCGKILSSHVALKNHEEKHLIDAQSTQIKKFICDVCGIKFRLKSYLFNHMHNMHLRTKYVCNFCQRGFYKKYEMHDHVRQFHTMETPFQCDFEGCKKSFARKKNLNIHRRIHTGERPYPCTLCDKSFMHFIDRKRHMMKHTGSRPYNCEICKRGFTRKGELENHTRGHYRDKVAGM